MEIDQHLAKLWATVGCPFWTHDLVPLFRPFPEVQLSEVTRRLHLYRKLPSGHFGTVSRTLLLSASI